MGSTEAGDATMRDGGRFLLDWLSRISEGEPLRAFLGIFLIAAVLVLVLLMALFDPGLRGRSKNMSQI